MTEVGTWELGEPAAEAQTLPELLRGAQEKLFAVLRAAGFHHPAFTGRSDALQLTARCEGRPVLVAFAPVAEHAMALEALAEADCRAALQFFPKHDVAYAALVLSRADRALDLVGLRPVRRLGRWLADEPAAAQFLPLSLSTVRDALRPILGGAAVYKKEHVLLPFLRSAGKPCRFRVENLWDESLPPQGTALRAFAAPTLLLTDDALPFYDDGAPQMLATLQAVQGDAVQLADEAGRSLWAGCAEARLYPDQLPTEQSYRWALSLVAERVQRQPLAMPVQPEGQSLSAEVGQLALLAQPKGDAQTLLGGCVRSAESVSVCSRPMTRALLAFSGTEVAVYLGAEEPAPAAGDWILVRGALRAVPVSLMGQGMDERQAVQLFARAMASRDWEALRPLLAEDFEYRSAQLARTVRGAEDFLHYMEQRYEEWARHTGLEGVSFECGALSYHGQRRPCCMISYYGRRDCGLVLRVRNRRVLFAETVSLEMNDRFEPEPAAALPGVFAPYASPMVPHPAVLSPLQRFMMQVLDRKIRRTIGLSEHYGDGKARWLQVLCDEPSFCDAAFQFGPYVYAVQAVKVPELPTTPEAVMALADEQLLAAAERYDLVPCVFPVVPGLAIEADTDWNLWNMRSGEPVLPEAAPTPEHTPSFAWDAFLEAEQVVRRQLEEQGAHVITGHNTPDILPHLWFRDASGTLSWCIVRTQNTPEPADTPPGAEEARVTRLLSGTPGFIADVGFTAPDGHSPAQRGARHLYFTHPLRPAEG